MLQLYDTFAREKRPFEPGDPQRVTLYVCGPTVYNYAHVGNARPAVVFDVLFRVLRRLYGEDAVIYARNITDVDDRINAAAAEQGAPISAITDRFLEIYREDTARLGVLAPTLEPRVTAYMAPIVEMIRRLVERGAAYEAEGHVLFDTTAFADYGELSRRPLEDMIAGARVDVAPYKRSPGDFVLWKPSSPRDPAWESPWGPGRPGWHIECSAMIEADLGLPIDIHGGGLDLIFPHHENENAQGRCANGHETYARFWMHNGMLNLSSEKMSKSLGNVLLVHDLVKETPGEVVRWALLSGHYRAPLDWTGELLAQSRRSLDRLYGALRRAQDVDAEGEASPAFLEALHDDLNTPRAVAELFALAKTVETGEGAERARAKGALLSSARLLGFLESEPDAWFEGAADEGLKDRVDSLLAERIAARAAKDWANADRIRAELDGMGVVVMDGPQGATWRLKEPV